MRRFFSQAAVLAAIAVIVVHAGSGHAEDTAPPAKPVPPPVEPSHPAPTLLPTFIPDMSSLIRSSSVSGAGNATLPSEFLPGSISCGAANRGALSFPAHLPLGGTGFVVPNTWEQRGRQFGTDELVGVIQRAAKRVDQRFPGSILGVADLSKVDGGALSGHRSHQSGRDADLLYYAIDEKQRFVSPEGLMPVYTRSGKAYYSKAPTWNTHIRVRYFDLARNWALVRALLTDRQAEVTNIFVARRIKYWLIRYAEKIGEPKTIVHRARMLVAAPKNAQSHNDHMHIRVACGSDDRAAGRCRNDLAPRRRRGDGKWHRRVRCPAPPPAVTP